MPRIDIDNIKTSFKKKEYRAWDNNLLDALKMPKNKNEEEPVLQSHPTISNTTQNVKEADSNDSGFNKGSIRVQKESNKGSLKVQIESNEGAVKVLSEPNYSPIKAQVKDDNKVHLGFNEGLYEIEKLIRKLGGNEQKIFFYIIDICIARGSLSTGEIPGKVIANTVSTTRNGMETALKRLRKKGLILREKGKTGKNGLINIVISEVTKNEAIKYLHTNQLDQEILRNRGSIGVQLNRINKVQLESGDPIYSSNRYKNTTTALPDEWKKINFSPLESIGFSEQHLADIFETNLCDPNVVQESIYHFAFGLDEGKYKTYDNPLKVFIGRLRKGNPWFESNYESPKERALRELFERKKAEKEKRDTTIKEIVDIEFPNWRKKLTEDEVKKIVPSETLASKLAPAITAALRTYYVENVLLPNLEMA